MYQDRDHEVIDYQLYELEDTGYRIRGPAPATLERRKYFTALGAAQTFGCFCEQPYPALLSERLGLPALNLGFAGAGPRLFLPHKLLLQYVNQGRFAIVQVMSGRSEDNSLFESGGTELVTRRSDGRSLGAEPAYRELLESESPETVAAVLEETRENWVQSFTALLEAIEVPKILFWFSTRSPDHEERYDEGVFAFFGKYPQLVNRSMVERIKPLADFYVESISDRGLPQPLVSRFTGEPARIEHRADIGGDAFAANSYYPSPQMHEDAAAALVETCRQTQVPPGYQRRDHAVVDYGLTRVPGVRWLVRGPAPETADGEYFTCLGAAQTFGCFCDEPYPALLAGELGLPVLNFGFAGAGPRFFADHGGLIKFANGGRLAIVQVMSGRSEDNSVFASGGREQLTRRSDGAVMDATDAYAWLLENEGVDRVREVVEETRAAWIESCAALLRAIEVPTVLLWFSQRGPDYDERYDDVWGLLGDFPQLVNRAMVDAVKGVADEYVECVTARGFPQRLFSRFTGEPVEVKLGGEWTDRDIYYPAPEMHEDAARALMGTTRELLSRAGHGGSVAPA